MMSSDDTGRCDRCEEQRKTTTLYRDGHVWASFCIECHDKIVEFALNTSDESEQTPQEEWEAHNESFEYEPPQKRPESWSSDEYQELHDRVIIRRTQWFCDRCSGHGPMSSLQKARRHVQNQHSPDLVKQYAPNEEELETATDSNNSKDHTANSTDENHGLNDFSGGKSV